MKLKEPDLRVAKMAQTIRDLAEHVRRNEQKVRPQMGKWESEIEAFNLILLSAAHALACAKLAKSSLSFLPSAKSLARAGMEAGARSMWLLSPENPYEREARWLVHLDTDEDIRARQGSATAPLVKDFAESVRRLMPDDVLVPKKMPKFVEILRAIGAPEKYIAYAHLSQYAHGTHYGTGVYRQHLGTSKEFGEFIKASDWWLPLSLQWWFLAYPLMSLAERCTITEPCLLPLQLQERFVVAQKAYR